MTELDLSNPDVREQMINGNMAQDLPEPEPEATEAPQEDEDKPSIEEEPKPTQPPASKQEEDDEDDLKISVPKARLDKEIQKRRELERELDKALIQQKMIDDALRAYADGGKEDEAKEYDPLDPETHKLAKEAHKKIAQLEAKQTQEAELNSFAATLADQETVFMREAPDFRDALAHVKAVKYQEMLAVSDTDADALEATKNYLLGLSAKAHEKGKNVPEMLYNLAKKSGYVAKDTKKVEDGPNLEKIAANKGKSSSVATIPAASTGANVDLDTHEGFKKLLDKRGRTDISKLEAEIARIKRASH